MNKLTPPPSKKKGFAGFHLLEIRKFCYLNYLFTVIHVSGTGLHPNYYICQTIYLWLNYCIL